MDDVLIYWISVVVIFVIGALSHFFYDWTRHNRIVGLFSAVNESTWEHIKIALTAAFLWAIVDGFLYGTDPNYFSAKLVSLFIMTITIPALFYFYRLFSKKSILIVDITIFYIAILLGQLSFYNILAAPNTPYIIQYFSCIGLFVFFGCYMTLTLEPLKTFLFKDPINGKYGFRAHQHILKAIKKKRENRKDRKTKQPTKPSHKKTQ